MSTVEERLAALGLTVHEVVPPLASYVPAVRSGRYVHTSGQLPIVDGVLLESGKVGASVTAERAAELAAVCALNAIAAVKSVAPLDSVTRIVKVTGFVASAPDFTGQPTVMNGASNLLLEAFGDIGRHARSSLGVAVLPMDAPVEVEMIVELGE